MDDANDEDGVKLPPESSEQRLSTDSNWLCTRCLTTNDISAHTCSNAGCRLSRTVAGIGYETSTSASASRLELGERCQRCGQCGPCRSANCGACVYCKDMPCFGGKGVKRQPCQQRVCEVLAAQAEERAQRRAWHAWKKLESFARQSDRRKWRGERRVLAWFECRCA